MKEYIEREATKKMFEDDYNFDASTAIDKIPSADVVEVVRCKDCLFGHRDYDYRLGYTCEKPLYHPAIGETPHRKLMQDCDYCSHGVKRID